MSILVNAEVDGVRLHDGDIVSESLLILNGGDETTRHVISGGVYQLLADPTNWRHSGPIAACCRSRSRRCCAGSAPSRTWPAPPPSTPSSGVNAISAGDTLLLLYSSANRDERVFADPFRFDIRRTPERPRRVRLRSPLLSRCQPRPPRTHRRPGPAPRSSARSGPRRRHGADAPGGQLRQRLRTDARSFQPVPARMTCPGSGCHPGRPSGPHRCRLDCLNLTSMSITVGSMSVEGRSFIVTGGGSGIGAACARLLADSEARRSRSAAALRRSSPLLLMHHGRRWSWSIRSWPT